MAPQYLVDVLAMEVGARRVTVNSIEPTAIDGAGVFTHTIDNDPLRQQIADPTDRQQVGHTGGSR
jgi:3-oxoacyl-[acyl-carrier protein] reductase